MYRVVWQALIESEKPIKTSRPQDDDDDEVVDEDAGNDDDDDEDDAFRNVCYLKNLGSVSFLMV